MKIVLFLQSYRLQIGDLVVDYGAAAGLVPAVAPAYLTFVGHRRVPYKRTLVMTGILSSAFSS